MFRWMKNLFGRTDSRRTTIQREGRRGDWEAAADTDRLSGWTTADNGTINALIVASLDKLRARSRYMARNSEIIARYIAVAKRNIIGTEMRLKRLGDWRKSKRLENALDAHDRALAEQSKAENFTASGSLTRGETENLIMEHIIRDGECLIQRVRNYRKNKTGYTLRLLDPALLATYMTTERAAGLYGSRPGERIIAGVGIDEDYRVVSYYFNGNGKASSMNDILIGTNQIVRVPASNILHIYEKQFANQIRGVPWLAPVLTKAETLRRYEETALQAARVGAAKHMTVQTQRGDSFRGDKTAKDGERVVSMDGSDVSVLGKGETLEFNDPAYPHGMFESFVAALQNEIAGGLDSTPPILTGNWAGINFSAGQLLSLDDREKWETKQQWFVDKFVRWWHEDWILYQALHGGFYGAGGQMVSPSMISEFRNVEWIGKRFAAIDPKKAAEAAAVRIQSGTSSIADEIRRDGREPEQTFMEIEDERKRGFHTNPKKSDIMPSELDSGDEE